MTQTLLSFLKGSGGLASFLEIDYWQLQALQGFWVAWSCPWNEGAPGHRQDSGAPPPALPCCLLCLLTGEPLSCPQKQECGRCEW